MRITIKSAVLAVCMAQLLAATEPADADVPESCVVRFTNGGAIPGTGACLYNAATSAATLNSYGCDYADAQEFCGELNTCPDGYLPDYDTGECIKVGDEGGPEGDDEGGPEGDDGGGPEGDDGGGPEGDDGGGPEGDDGGGPEGDDGGGPEGDDGGGPENTDEQGAEGTSENNDASSDASDDSQPDTDSAQDVDGTSGDDTADEEVEVIIGGGGGAGNTCEYGLPDFDSGRCPAPPELQPLEDYDEQQSNVNSDCDIQSEPIPNIPGPVGFVTQGLQFVDNVVISNLGTISAGISAINLVEAATIAEQTGDTTEVFEQAYGLLLPLFPEGTTIDDAFQIFSDYISDSLSGTCN